jgi:hypothetical protein
VSPRTVHKFTDANQPDIVRALRAAGVAVYLLGDPLDLLCARGGQWFLLETKNRDGKKSGPKLVGLAATKPGGEWHDVEQLYPGRARYLRKTQAQFIRDFHPHGGKIAVVYDSAEALAATACLRCRGQGFRSTGGLDVECGCGTPINGQAPIVECGRCGASAGDRCEPQCEVVSR